MEKITEKLQWVAIWCCVALTLFVIITVIAIFCKSTITNIILTVSAIIAAISFVAFMFTLWIIKEMHPEQVKLQIRILQLIDNGSKENTNELLSRNFEELKKAVNEVSAMIENAKQGTKEAK